MVPKMARTTSSLETLGLPLGVRRVTLGLLLKRAKVFVESKLDPYKSTFETLKIA
jgi:hypothetical protein